MSSLLTISIKGIYGFIERKITKFGADAKEYPPKESIGKKVYIVITQDKY